MFLLLVFYKKIKKKLLKKKKKAFFIISEGLSVAKNCLRPDSAPLKKLI